MTGRLHYDPPCKLRHSVFALGNALGQSLADSAGAGGDGAQPQRAVAETAPTGQGGLYGLGELLGSTGLPEFDWGVGRSFATPDGGTYASGLDAVEQFLDSDDDALMGGQRQVGVAGKDAAGGAWGIAKARLGANASNGAVNRYKNQLLTLNPELANGVQAGQQYYLPDDGTPENLTLARAADRRFNAVAVEPQSASVVSSTAQGPATQSLIEVGMSSPPQGTRAVGSREWFQTASDAELHAAGYQTARAYTPEMAAADRAVEVRRAALLNFLNGQGSLALGGVVSAGVMVGTGDVLAASATTDVVGPLDNLLAPMGGRSASGTLSRLRGRNGLVNDLKTFEPETMQFGNNTYLLDRRGMKHILERHHPDYWAGETKNMQTFLNPSMSIDDVANVVRDVMKQNRTQLAEPLKPFGPQIEATVGGVDYVLGISRGRIGQLYPKPMATGK